tara:strand:- start:203 stop:391 length:189 start_codon:yes stop_codon:yes gene_type:complete
MNYEKEYDKIPLAVLLDVGFPTNVLWLNDAQRHLMEYVFDEYYKEIHLELERCNEDMEECCE